jgi:hypothetical protein
MNSRVKYYGSYKTTKTVAGVSFTYLRTKTFSTITIAGMWALIKINDSLFIWLYQLKYQTKTFHVENSLSSMVKPPLQTSL